MVHNGETFAHQGILEVPKDIRGRCHGVGIKWMEANDAVEHSTVDTRQPPKTKTDLGQMVSVPRERSPAPHCRPDRELAQST